MIIRSEHQPESQAGRGKPAYYPATERMAILLLRAANGWSLKQAAKRFFVTPATEITRGTMPRSHGQRGSLWDRGFHPFPPARVPSLGVKQADIAVGIDLHPRGHLQLESDLFGRQTEGNRHRPAPDCVEKTLKWLVPAEA